MSDADSSEPSEQSQPRELWDRQVEAINNAGFELRELADRALALAQAAVSAVENGEIGVADAAVTETDEILRQGREVFFKYGGPFGLARPADDD